MSHVPQPALPSRTWLYDWGWWSWNLANIFYWCGYSIKDTWLVGPALFQWFLDLADPCYEIGHICWKLDYDIRVKWSWIVGITEQWTFLDILDYFSFYYKWLRDDATGFVKWFFGTIDFDRYWFLWDVQWWFRWRFTSIVGWLENFLTEPWNWLDSLLGQVRYWLRYFIDDPISAVRSWVITSFPFLYDMFINTLVWIVNILDSYTGWFWDFIIDPWNFIISRVRSVHWELSQFMDNPIGWFCTKLAYAVNLLPYELADLPMAVFKRMMHQIRIRRGEVQQLIEIVVCDIVCWFI